LEDLGTAISEVAQDTDLRGRITAQGIEPRVIALRDFDVHIRHEMERLAPLTKSLGSELGN
jgi:tripartite-type tricarboxylate transporter receptor subunit TctC